MDSKIATAINLKYNPVAVIRADEKPEKSLQFKKGKWGCVMFMFANAAEGKTTAFECGDIWMLGGGVGLLFGNTYLEFPGGIDCSAHFLSTGNDQWEKGRQVAGAVEQTAGKKFSEDFQYRQHFTLDIDRRPRGRSVLPFQQGAA